MINPKQQKSRLRDPVIIDIESYEVMTHEAIAEVHEIWADMLFQYWKKKKGFK